MSQGCFLLKAPLGLEELHPRLVEVPRPPIWGFVSFNLPNCANNEKTNKDNDDNNKIVTTATLLTMNQAPM